MGGIVDSFFGSKSKTKTTEQANAVPVDFESMRTPSFRIGGRQLFSVSGSGNVGAQTNPQLSLAAERTRGYALRSRNRLTPIAQRLSSNTNEFVDARVRPLEQRLDTTIADQTRELSRRGVFGSIANNELNKTRFLGEREIGDARSMATQEAFNQLLGVEAGLRGANEQDMAQADLLFKDELAKLGISAEVLLGLLNARRQTTQIAGGTTTVSNREAPSPAKIIGSILAAS